MAKRRKREKSQAEAVASPVPAKASEPGFECPGECSQTFENEAEWRAHIWNNGHANWFLHRRDTKR